MNGARTWQVVETLDDNNGERLGEAPWSFLSRTYRRLPVTSYLKRMYAARTARKMEQSQSYRPAYIKPVRELYMLRQRHSGRLSVTGRISG